ncbi:MAG: hypothetical protein H0T46_28650 [Deltaproteobacteria bacterium]|nr:hypothetical protein [Deltaproteobacteria bacterium]
MASNGTDYFVVWNEYLGNGNTVARGAIVRASNGTLGPVVTVAQNTTAGSTPDVTFVGGVYLVVVSMPAGSMYTVRGVRVDPAGTIVDSTPFLIAPPGDATGPHTTSIGGSVAIVSYIASPMINFVRVNVAGTPTIGTPFARPQYSGVNVGFDGVSVLGEAYINNAGALVSLDPFTDPPTLIATTQPCGSVFASDLQGTTLCVSGASARFITNLPNGKVCLLDGECGSGHCVDGVCCNETCGGNTQGDCRVCSVARGASADGVCSIASTAHVCRTPAGPCDAAESCDGASASCPQDGFLPPTATCRGINGACDVTELCTGASVVCPVDKFVTVGIECRAATAGGCDLAEVCTGMAAACPLDRFKMPGTSCRASGGDCDSAEVCSGGSPNCPADVLTNAGVTCRNAVGLCDVAEACTGTTSTCPTDGFVGAGVACRPVAGQCDVSESCSGGSAQCPTDAFLPSTTECRGSGGVCDPAESCTGSQAACPTDAKHGASTTCRSAAGDCDVAEACNGTDVGCPADGVKSMGLGCRTAAGICDLAEVCDGVAKACPTDGFRPVGTPCRDSSMACDPAEQCEGTASCPQDIGCSGPVDAGVDARPSDGGGSGGGSGGGNNPGEEDPYESGQGCSAGGGLSLLPGALALLGLCVRRRRGAIAMLVLAALCATASAQPGDKVQSARSHFRQGKAFLEAKLYDDAIREFEASYRLVPEPELIFNIAAANRLKGNPAEALAGYQRYLAAAPKGRGADTARKYVAELTKLLRDQEAQKQAEAEAAKLAEAQKQVDAQTDALKKAEAQKALDAANKAEAERLEADRLARLKQEEQEKAQREQQEAEEKRIAAAGEESVEAKRVVVPETPRAAHRGAMFSIGGYIGGYDAPATFENSPSATVGGTGVAGWYVADQVALVAAVRYESVFSAMTFSHVTAGGGVSFPMGATSLRITAGASILTGAATTVTGFGVDGGLTIKIAGPIALTIDGYYAFTGTPTVVGAAMGLAYARN